MSKTEGFLILETRNAAAGGGADEAARQYPQNMARRKLADISNLPQKPKPSVQDDKSKSIPVTAKAYIEQLQKENMALGKMLVQRNKIIEQSGIELERLRSILIQVQEQNQQLALSHTQMLRELNLGKDRLKALQHELGCKNGLLKARKLEGGEACKIPGRSADAEVNLVKLPKEGETLSVCKDNGKPHNNKRSRLQSSGSSEPLQSEDSNGNRRPSVRRQSARFKAAESKSVDHRSERDDSKFSECPLPQEPVVENGLISGSTSVEEDNNLVKVDLIKLPEEGETSHVGRDAEQPRNVKRRLRSQSLGSFESLQPEENAGNRRVSVRRQSARLKALEQKTVGDESEKHDIKFLEQGLPDEKSVLENGSTSKSGSATDGDNRGSSGFEYNPPEIGRSSLSRPSRLAAKKVQSYKEIPLNIKMRRE